MKYLTNSGLSYFLNKIKAYIASQLNSKASAIHTHTSSDITDLPSGYVVDSALSSSSENPVQNKVVKNALDGKANSTHTHSKSQITDFPSYGTTANTICEGNDSRLSDARTPTSHTHVKSEITDFPAIPTVYNKTLTIQKNGTNVATFTSNSNTDVTANISVPTKTSDLTNDSGYITVEEQGEGYIRYSNGIQICWGLGEYDEDQVVSYAKAFIEFPSVVASCSVDPENWNSANFVMKKVASGHAYASWQAIGRWK